MGRQRSALGSFTTRPELAGTRYGISTTHWLASGTGMAILESGGSVFDAAVGAAFVLQVVEPHQNGPGGEVPIILKSSSSSDVMVISGQGPSPQDATVEHFRGLGLDLIPGSGLLPACVPGAVDAWLLLLQRYGRLELPEVLGYAIEYAHGGFPVSAGLAEVFARQGDTFTELWPSTAELYMSTGQPLAGDLIRNPAIARVLMRLVEEAKGPTRISRIQAARDAF